MMRFPKAQRHDRGRESRWPAKLLLQLSNDASSLPFPGSDATLISRRRTTRGQVLLCWHTEHHLPHVASNKENNVVHLERTPDGPHPTALQATKAPHFTFLYVTAASRLVHSIAPRFVGLSCRAWLGTSLIHGRTWKELGRSHEWEGTLADPKVVDRYSAF